MDTFEKYSYTVYNYGTQTGCQSIKVDDIYMDQQINIDKLVSKIEYDRNILCNQYLEFLLTINICQNIWKGSNVCMFGQHGQVDIDMV